MDYSHPPLASAAHAEGQYPYSRSVQSRSASYSSRFIIDTSLSSQPIRPDFPHLGFAEGPRTAPLDYSSSFSSSRTCYSPTYTTSVVPVPQSAAFVDSPVSTTFSSWDTFSPRALARRWTGSDVPTDQAVTAVPPNMSTMAVQYDPSFGTATRSSYTWPTVLEPEMAMDHLSDANAVASSPPRAAFAPEQRELKRQQDQARRDSKMSMRVLRANSHPYAPQSPPPAHYAHHAHHAPQSPPLALSDTPSAMNMTPVYTTGPAPISLLSEPPSTTLPSHQYMQPYSPPLTEHGQYTPTYAPPMQHGYNMSVDYSSPYSGPSSYDARQGAMSGMYSVSQVMPSPGEMHEDAHVRIVQSRPKPRCWDHGCNGRQFSTFSNLLRHQREKSGQATKSLCPQCGQSFTRSTARNGHLSQGKCRGRSDDENDFANDMHGEHESIDEHNDDQSSSPEAGPLPLP